MPVSYAAPTYYADHLAERGRKYLKPFLDGDFDTVADLYLDFTRNNPAKIDASHWEDLQQLQDNLKNPSAEYHAEARDLIRSAADLAFKNGDEYKGTDTSDRGPWHKNLDNTMFWL
jgi:eukaryotic translation initiation factor 2C